MNCKNVRTTYGVRGRKLLIAAVTAVMILTLTTMEIKAWNVFMAGDSHVCSKIYPREVERVLCEEEPDIHFSFYGQIGATFGTYIETPHMMQEIYGANPDVLIVHLGTNDSYTRNFNRNRFLKHVEIFHGDVEEHLPDCKIVYVTPFYNRLHGAEKPNRATRTCSDALLDFAAGHRNAYVVDNNASHGMHFLKNREELMRHDFVHLTPKGYEELGREVGEALAEMEDLWIIEEPPYIEETAYQTTEVKR